MVKSIHHITIRDYSLFEKTGNKKTLVKGLFWREDKLEKLLIEIATGLGSEQNQDQALKKEYHRLTSLYRIEYLIILYEATYNLLINKMQIDQWKTLLRKPKPSDYTTLIEYVARIKDETGIEISPENWYDGMIALKSMIDRWTDKYQENFSVPDQVEGVTFMQIVLGVFSILKFPINEDICLSDFFEMKRQAEQIIRKMELKSQQDAG